MPIAATTMMARRFMETLQEVERTRDIEPLVALFADDAEVSNLALSEPLKGKDGVRRFWSEYLHAFDSVRSEFTHVHENRNAIVLEWTSSAVLHCNCDEITYDGVSILEIKNGFVSCFRAYYDTAALRQKASDRESTKSQAA